MFILSIQTAHKIESISLAKVESSKILDFKEIFFEELAISENIGEITNQLCKYFKIEIKDISKVLVCIGPGSYTGLRIGLAFSKAMAQFQKIELIPINYLLALEYIVNQRNSSEMTEKKAIMDARNKNVYITTNNTVEIIPVEKLDLSKSYIGSGCKYLEENTDGVQTLYLTAYDMIQYFLLSKEKFEEYTSNNLIELTKLLPIYVQEPRIG